MCAMLSIAIIKRFKLGKCAKLSRAKLASRRSGTRPTGPRQTRTRQKGRAKLDCNPLALFTYIIRAQSCSSLYTVQPLPSL